MDEKYKASRKGWISGYSTGLARGSGLAFAMVALFALLVVLNPLNFTYAQAYVYTGPETCQEMVYSGGIEIVCETLHPYAVLYWTYFAISVVFYAVFAAVLTLVPFALIFNVRRIIEKADIIDAARESLGLFKKDEDKEKEQ